MLVGEDTSQSLVSGDTTLAYPTDFKQEIAIVLIDGNSNEKAPLKEFVDGHRQYRQLRLNDSNTGLTEFFSKFNEKFFLYRPANQAYTTRIEYNRFHPQTPEDILFTEQFRNVIKFGVTYYKSVLKNNTRYINTWGPTYFAEKKTRIISAPSEPAIVRSGI